MRRGIPVAPPDPGPWSTIDWIGYLSVAALLIFAAALVFGGIFLDGQ